MAPTAAPTAIPMIAPVESPPSSAAGRGGSEEAASETVDCEAIAVVPSDVEGPSVVDGGIVEDTRSEER